jgi:hypothetical protein
MGRRIAAHDEERWTRFSKRTRCRMRARFFGEIVMGWDTDASRSETAVEKKV